MKSQSINRRACSDELHNTPFKPGQRTPEGLPGVRTGLQETVQSQLSRLISGLCAGLGFDAGRLRAI